MESKKHILISAFFVTAVLFVCVFSSISKPYSLGSYFSNKIINSQLLAPKKDPLGNVLYKGTIYHIFFHSLIVYPELAFNGNKNQGLYENYMITRDEFNKILPELYKNNFVLIDINSIYKINKDGTVVRKPIYIPKGKKPLIISIDDLSYYRGMQGHGFANKLVLDENGNVATEVITPKGETVVTHDGDVVPILDAFVADHPDFSMGGAKGTIALTGYEGVLGYRTEATTSKSYLQDIQSAKNIIDKLKSTGWSFASHSYSHDQSFINKTISLENLKKDSERWDREVKPLVGDTNIFIGPFGQVFSQGDPRRAYLVSKGFKVLCGVGVNPYLRYFSDYVAMDRADIDGYRFSHTANLLKTYFDPKVTVDSRK
ncbi:MAG: hypothetical protein WCO12_00780 [bacterium]